jgi:hypothetical protein
MTKKILLAAILGGVLMFFWEGLAHDALPIGKSGLKALSNEQVITALKDNVKEAGLYVFPWAEPAPGMTKEQKLELMRKSQEQWYAGPSGLMVFHPSGPGSSFPSQLATQLTTDIVLMLLAAFLLTKAVSLNGYGARVLFVALLGLIPTLATGIPQWNWYGFPAAFVLAQAFTHLVGFLLGGLIVAKLVRPVYAK